MMAGGGVYSGDGTSILLTAGQFSLNGGGSSRATNIAGINGTQSTGLSVNIPATPAGRHNFHGALIITNGNTTSMTFQIHALGSASILRVTGWGYSNGGVSTPVTTTTTGSAFNTGVGVGAGTSVIFFWGTLSTNAAADTLQIDMVDTGTTNTLLTGSYIMMLPEEV